MNKRAILPGLTKLSEQQIMFILTTCSPFIPCFKTINRMFYLYKWLKLIKYMSFTCYLHVHSNYARCITLKIYITQLHQQSRTLRFSGKQYILQKAECQDLAVSSFSPSCLAWYSCLPWKYTLVDESEMPTAFSQKAMVNIQDFLFKLQIPMHIILTENEQ